MRPYCVALSVVLLVSPCFSSPRYLVDRGVHPASVDAGILTAPGELLIGWTGDAASKTATDVATRFGLTELPAPALNALGTSRYSVGAGRDSLDVAAEIAALPNVRFAEPNVILMPAEVPSDPLYAGVSSVPTDLQRWAYAGIGDNSMLNAEGAWDVTKGDPSVVIAVLDSGLDLDNPEFTNVWVNRGEIPANGVDDDHNGFVDDVNGYDFHNHRGDITPDLGDGIDNDNNERADDSAPHGTIAASIIGAAHDGAGMAGGAPGCAMMIVKIFGDDGGVTVADLAEAIKYAADNGADVLNLSLSTPFDSEALFDAVRYAVAHDVVMVAAAGNGNSAAPYYPASYNLVVSVGGTGSGFSRNAIEMQAGLGAINGRWPKSQFGPAAVDVVAPAVTLGSSVVTVALHNEDPTMNVGDTFYGFFEGTSFAAPYVSALAGLVISRDKALHGRRTLNPDDIQSLILWTTTDLPRDGGDTQNSGASWDGKGRVNFARALDGIPGAKAPAPNVTGANFHKLVLRVYGDAFTTESTIEINGKAVTAPIAFSFADRKLEVHGGKKSLGIKKKGHNILVVTDRGVRSPEYTF